MNRFVASTSSDRSNKAVKNAVKTLRRVIDFTDPCERLLWNDSIRKLSVFNHFLTVKYKTSLRAGKRRRDAYARYVNSAKFTSCDTTERALVISSVEWVELLTIRGGWSCKSTCHE